MAIPSDDDSSTTQTELRFPTAVASIRLSSWLHQSASTVMSVPSESNSNDHSSLGDSAYEFIDTDTESRDGNKTESVASTDYNGPDDIASLDDTEQSDDECESESGIPAVAGLDGPIDTPTVDQSAADFQDDMERCLARSIEFEEPLDIGIENVSVKHTVAEFDEEETANIAKITSPHSRPHRMVATIRQTMTRQGLSTKEPLRILYVGSHSAKQDILHKIASSVAASVEYGARSGILSGSPQLFNVVPVTAFGSEKTPEVELMRSSGYQIKVEDCSTAINLKFEDEPGKPDVIKLTVDDSYSYHSVPDGKTFIVEPSWELPHVAIFYCSDNDTVDARRTRTFSRTFMSRHKIPSIVISHKTLYEKSLGCLTLDQHAIHMCLESRDVSGSRNIIHQRLPIDLTSFMNIDARQMNRNLAYLTGLHEPLPAPAQRLVGTNDNSRADPTDIEKASTSFAQNVNILRAQTRAHWIPLLPIGMLLFSVLAAVTTKMSYRSLPLHGLSINGILKSTGPMLAVPSTKPSPASTLMPSLSTSTEIQTSTKTITVTRAQSSGSSSLDVMQKMDIGKLSEKINVLPSSKSVDASDERTTICGAEVLGDREILIRIPTATLTSWLGKDAMSLNVSRLNNAVEMERVYSTTDGIVLQLTKREAYGILNISIITTRKPKINETFQIDFGSSWAHDFDELLRGISTQFSIDADERSAPLYDAINRVRTIGSRVLEQAHVPSNLARSDLLGVNKHATAAAAKLTSMGNTFSMALAKRTTVFAEELCKFACDTKSTIERKSHAFVLREPIDHLLLKAQIKSKLAWLRFKGKDSVARDYERRAGDLMGQRQSPLKKAKRLSSEEERKGESSTRRTADGRKCGRYNTEG
ncbi:MAG: hypothetical protein M1818_007282 [Claussenomyces sp. TS43310]|nr:MAG: hypothetical protein M1818_007282 [Claussenomyces sp. TS43310]